MPAKKIQCDCGSSDFEIAAATHDTVTFLCQVYEDGSFETSQTLKDYVGDTDYEDEVECFECGNKLDLSTLGNGNKDIEIAKPYPETEPRFRVFIQLEEYLPENDEYESIDVGAGPIATFHDQALALEFAERLSDIV